MLPTFVQLSARLWPLKRKWGTRKSKAPPTPEGLGVAKRAEKLYSWGPQIREN
jgi:hypothetical protein